ncbi:MAG: hypothetical protein QM703_25975 [Gemmatales bacterium]
MFMRLLVVMGCLGLTPALWDTSAVANAQGKKGVAQKPAGQKSAAQGARPYLPGYHTYLLHRHGWHRVDYKVSAWVNLPAANQAAAKTLAKNYRMHGWTTQIVQPSKGTFVVKARLNRWRTATYTGHLRIAEGIAMMLRYQGYQARVAY